MAHAKDKWVRRFLIPETARHKKGFTVYRVTSVVFARASYEEASKVSVWKRYNDFKKLHSELSILYSSSPGRESFPPFAKPKFFGRFEVEIIEERRQYALKFLEFVSRHACLFSSNTFINFFETSHRIDNLNDCSLSISSDTSEDDHNNVLNNANAGQAVDYPLICGEDYKDSLKILPKKIGKSNEEEEDDVPNRGNHFNNTNVNHTTPSSCNGNYQRDGSDHRVITQEFAKPSMHSQTLITLHDGTDLLQAEEDASCYILIAAAHMSAAFRHEAIAEYEEAFTQYKMGISNLLNGVQSDPNIARVGIIKDKISKYLARAERLYNRHLNCNVSLLCKPVLELQYYKVLRVIKPVMLVEDRRVKHLRIVKTIERPCNDVDNISNYILRGQIPYMVKLYACVETETTIFLVLQYVSRGKLWGFIKSHYHLNPKSQTAKQHSHSCNCIASIQPNSEAVNDDREQKSTPLSYVTSAIESVPKNSYKANVTLEDSKTTDANGYRTNVSDSDEMSTAQLLANAQKLLQSVNATLKKSNSVANRLNESEHLLYDCNSTSCLDVKNIVSCDEKNNGAINGTKQRGNNSASKNEEQWLTVAYDLRGSVNNETGGSIINNGSVGLDVSKCALTNVSNQRHVSQRDSPGQSPGGAHFLHTNNTPNSSETLISNLEICIDDKTNLERVRWQIPQATTRLWAAEILLALEALHQQEVVISDLSPDKILLDDSGHILLTYITPRRNAKSRQFKGPYSAPELCAFSPLNLSSPSADIWSFGIILYELLSGLKFQSKHYGSFHSHSSIDIPTRISDAGKSLLTNILRYQPCDRLTIPKIKQHPFFEDMDWSNLVSR